MIVTKLKSFSLALSTVCILMGITWGIDHWRRKAPDEFVILGKVPNFCLTDQHNQSICNKDFKGKIWVVDFFFTSCPTICPVMAANMVAVQNAFPDNSIGIASFSIDPEEDTPEKLQEYAKEKGITSPHWHLLTGDEETIYELANKGFNIYAKSGNTPAEFEHSGLFALIDTQGNIISRKRKDGNPIFFYKGTEKEGITMLIEDIKKLKKQSLL